MDSLETFATKGGVTSSNVLKDSALAKKIIELAKPKRVMRQFCFDFPMDRLTSTLPKEVDQSGDMAVEVAEGSDIPIYRTKMDSQTIRLKKNATHFFMTKESEIEDFNGKLYDREANAAANRMTAKEDYDIATVMMAGATTSVSAHESGELDTFDLAQAKAKLRLVNRYGTDLLINPTQFADFEGEAVLKAIPYADPKEKTQGLNPEAYVVSGLKVTESEKIPAGTAFVLAKAAQPVWFCYNGATTTEPYTKPGVGRGAIITAFQNPICVEGSAICKITGC